MNIVTKCNQCGSALVVPLVDGAPWPAISTVCQKCGEGMMCVSMGSSTLNNVDSGSKPPRRRDTNERPVLLDPLANNSELPPYSLEVLNSGPSRGQPSGIYSGFLNRLAPSIIAGEIIAERGIDGISHDDLVEEFTVRSKSISDAMTTFERINGISRGQRISDGFPSEASSTSSMLIALKTTIGSNGRQWLASGGFLRETGALVSTDPDVSMTMPHEESDPRMKMRRPSVRHGDNVTLRDISHPIFSHDLSERLVNPSDTYFPLIRDSIEDNGIPLPNYFQDDLVRSLLEYISKNSPEEYSWMCDIVRKVRNAPITGWDSNMYASNNANDLIENRGEGTTRRWRNSRGDDLADVYVLTSTERAMKVKIDYDEIMDHSYNRLESHINGQLGGLLGRLKEMGVIYPVKFGRKKNFMATHRASWFE